jgi:hypothetical protein
VLDRSVLTIRPSGDVDCDNRIHGEAAAGAGTGARLLSRRSDGRLAPGSAADAIVSRDDRRRTNGATRVELAALLEYA